MTDTLKQARDRQARDWDRLNAKLSTIVPRYEDTVQPLGALVEVVAEMRQFSSGRGCEPPPCVADWADRIQAAIQGVK